MKLLVRKYFPSFSYWLHHPRRISKSMEIRNTIC